MTNWKMFLKTDRWLRSSYWWLRSSSSGGYGDYNYFSSKGEGIHKNTGHVYEGIEIPGLCSRVLDFPLACMI